MSRKDNYRSLKNVLKSAVERAEHGKGAIHATNEPFENQQICQRSRDFGIGFLLGQANKKLIESLKKLDKDDGINELLDVIVYTAAAIVVLKEMHLEESMK